MRANSFRFSQRQARWPRRFPSIVLIIIGSVTAAQHRSKAGHHLSYESSILTIVSAIDCLQILHSYHNGQNRSTYPLPDQVRRRKEGWSTTPCARSTSASAPSASASAIPFRQKPALQSSSGCRALSCARRSGPSQRFEIINLGNGQQAQLGTIDKDVLLGLVIDHAVHTDQVSIRIFLMSPHHRNAHCRTRYAAPIGARG